MKRFLLLGFIGLFWLSVCSQNKALPPDQLYKELFVDVQLKSVFPDSKTFVDCTPKINPNEIVSQYRLWRKDSVSDESLKQFVNKYFIIPESSSSIYQTGIAETIEMHIIKLWSVLRHEPDKDKAGSSLLPLPYSYIVPGGRFREIYYWDSYFTQLGLKQSGRWQTIEDMVNNFSFLIQTYGHIPNGNRTYYLSRSQPPFFSLMINLLAGKKGDSVFSKYLGSLRKEYDYWMDKTSATKHLVSLPDGSVLNRYYDQDSIPRQESYREDFELSQKEATGADQKNQTGVFFRMCRNLRSGAESGWDFSSRWFADGQHINTIQTIDIIPVDLNGLMYQMELTLAHAYRVAGNKTEYNSFTQKAKARKSAINKYCWNEKGKWYMDYNIALQQQSTEFTIAGISPLFFNIASKKQASEAEKTLKQKFLKSGGVVTTLKNTGQQWDAPNGWAPLQWIAIKGLQNYNLNATAREISKRWTKLNLEVYKRTGKLMEKYNVENTSLEAGGGEYQGQDGFGWTNGVLLKLISLYGK
ncbi:MAG TPA: trehalase [Prolixibacteraceae bacterium]|jgi:alpha,alpha-trehalase|nr:trehalase [Prolixibacteraceae bacterium]